MRKSAALAVLAALAAALAVFPAPPAGAQGNLMTDVYSLEAVEVVGEGGERIIGLDRSSEAFIERSRSNNVADFLVRDTEVSIGRRSSFGDSGDIVSIRGLDTSRIQVNMDGRDVSSTGVVGGNFLDFGTIPLDNVERVEVIKGGSSIEHGNTALGGVINVKSREPSEIPYLSLYGTFGGWSDLYDFHNVRGVYAQKFGPVGISLGLSHQANDAWLRNNDFELFHVYPKVFVDTPWGGQFTAGYNYSRAKRGLIITNRADGSVSSDSDPFRPGWDRRIDPDHPLASGESFAGGSQTPAMYVLGEGAHWVKQRHLADFGYNQKFGETGFLELLFYSNYEIRREKNYADVASRLLHQSVTTHDYFNPALTRDGALVMDKDVNVDRSHGYKVRGGFEIGAHRLVAGAEYKVRRTGGQTIRFVDENYNLRWQGGQSVGSMTGSGKGHPSYIIGAYLGDKFGVSDRLTLDLGVRYDGLDARSGRSDGSVKRRTQGGWSPKLMATWDITENQSASIALYRNMRVPAANEYGWFVSAADPSAGGTLITKVEGTELKMERANGIDVAWKLNFGGDGFVKVSAWYYDIRDFINMRSGLPQSERSVNSPGSGGNLRTSYNMDAWLAGATVSGSYRVAPPLVLDASVTWQDNRKSNDMFDPLNLSDSIEYVPPWKANVGAAWTIDGKTSLDVSILAVGRRHFYFSSGNVQHVGRLGAYATAGASLKRLLGDRTTMEIYVDNLTDAAYQERWGYPAMGFNAGVSLKWEL